ncbi:hypothetical protein PR202_gb22693 [Eleusine coracana subsp. coracana]|uniref:Reverse transcriptase zinc-binding domain-containing protein n=1 Tax=Eleusine coracana subsp. coracana TaxID=191504 RepID=A0AAV5FGY8_ELECO|nr:hypothetical protein PR202_gb22693 [Eleusine coracana subsp. coracana]
MVKIMRAFLWQGTDDVQGGKCLVAWNAVQRPLELGGLGVPNITLFSQALRLRWSWHALTQPDSISSQFPVVLDKNTLAFFRASVKIELGNGTQIKFWTDPWIDGHSIQELAPNLVQAVSKIIRKRRNVAEALHNRSWLRDVTGARTFQVIAEYITIRQLVDTVQLHQAPDRFSWRWSTDGMFSSSSAYKAFFTGQIAIPGAKELWKTRAPNKCRFFFWTLLHGRCWTAARLYRHGLRDNNICALCSQEAEDIDHLFLSCVYSREFWFKILRRCGWQLLTPMAQDCLVDWWLHNRKRIPKPRRRCFDSITILITWTLWLERNGRVFRNEQRRPATVLNWFWQELRLWKRAKLVDWSLLFPGE